jgi:hypothetical protein
MQCAITAMSATHTFGSLKMSAWLGKHIPQSENLTLFPMLTAVAASSLPPFPADFQFIDLFSTVFSSSQQFGAMCPTFLHEPAVTRVCLVFVALVATIVLVYTTTIFILLGTVQYCSDHPDVRPLEPKPRSLISVAAAGR